MENETKYNPGEKMTEIFLTSIFIYTMKSYILVVFSFRKMRGYFRSLSNLVQMNLLGRGTTERILFFSGLFLQILDTSGTILSNQTIGRKEKWKEWKLKALFRIWIRIHGSATLKFL